MGEISGAYYVAAGAIYRGTVTTALASGGSINWNATTNQTAATPVWPNASSTPAGSVSQTMTTFSGALWCGLYGSGVVYGLYSIAPDGTSATFQGGGGLLGTTTDPKQITLVQAVNGKLFVVAAPVSTSSNYIYEVDYFNGTTWSQLLTGLTLPVMGIAFDGANYWVVTQTAVYSGAATDPPTLGVNSAVTLAASDQFNGVFATGPAHSIVIIPTKLNGLWVSQGGAAFVNVTTPQISGVTVGMLCAAGPIDPLGTTNANTTYLVGSEGYGYYVLSVAGTPALTRFADNTIALYAYAVRRILVDSATDTVLMGTASQGVWRASFDPTSSAGALVSGTAWVHE
jgi:hypothetical protein